MASVYVFNTTNEDLVINLNNWPITCGAGTTKAPWQPNYQQVDIVAANEPQGQFGSQNILITSFKNVTGGYSYDLDIPEAGQEDLELYVFSNYIVLSRLGVLTGTVGDQSNVPFAGAVSASTPTG